MDQRIIAILTDLLDGRLSRDIAVQRIGGLIGILRGKPGDVFVNDAETIINEYTVSWDDPAGNPKFLANAGFHALRPQEGALGVLPPAPARTAAPAVDSVADQALRARGIDPTGALPETETDLFGAGALPTGGVTALPEYLRPEIPFVDEPTTWGQDYDVTPPVVGYTEPLPDQAVTQETLDIINPLPPLTMERLYGEGGAPYVQPVTPFPIQQALGLPESTGLSAQPYPGGGRRGPDELDPVLGLTGLQMEDLMKQDLPDQFRQWRSIQPWANINPLFKAATSLYPGIEAMYNMQFPQDLIPQNMLPATDPRAFMGFLRGNIGGRFDRPAVTDRLNLIQTLLNQPELGVGEPNPYTDAGGWGAERNIGLQQQYRDPEQQFDAFNLAATMGMAPRARDLLGGVYRTAFDRFKMKQPYGNFLNWARERNLGGWGDPSGQGFGGVV